MNLVCAAALIFMVDISGSVNPEEYNLQKEGIIKVLTDEEVQEIVLAQSMPIALTVIEWAEHKPQVIVPWTVVSNKQEISNFAYNYGSEKRPDFSDIGRSTYMGGALSFSVNYFNEVPCKSSIKIIDVSGDGIDDGPEKIFEEAKELAINNGIVINGLAILDSAYTRKLYEWYRDKLITNDGFVIISNGFDEFYKAMRRKFIREVAMK